MDGVPLILGILAAAALVWWLVKGLFKLAIVAAAVAAAAWFWYLN